MDDWVEGWYVDGGWISGWVIGWVDGGWMVMGE